MRLSKTHSSAAIGMNITPMIDIVFLLIIFFITVSQITPIVNYPVELPEARLVQPEIPPVKLTINIDVAGRIFVAGEELTSEQLLQRVQAVGRESGGDLEDVQVLIRCDRRTESRHVNQLIPRLSGMGITQVKISVQGKE